mmetsp:Transcript_131066/g.326991  ORF Transcript_131066/g.326991 Transcript_131066/m.326991 type:complete len:111 (-) Transcript_131066:47-379(-)
MVKLIDVHGEPIVVDPVEETSNIGELKHRVAIALGKRTSKITLLCGEKVLSDTRRIHEVAPLPDTEITVVIGKKAEQKVAFVDTEIGEPLTEVVEFPIQRHKQSSLCTMM